MKKKILGVIVIFAAMFMTFGVVKADEYFNANDNVSDNGTYSHSHFEAGNIITSSSNVNGLSFVAGANVNVSGTKEYSFVAGETVQLNGTIEKDVFAAGNAVIIGKDANIGRDLYLAGNSVTIQSNIKGTVFVAASLVKLENITVDGDVSIAANTLEIGGNVSINGKLKINDDAVINNESNMTVTNKEVYKSSGMNIDFSTRISDIILDILKTLFTGIVLILLFPKLFKKIKYDLEAKDIGIKLLYGLLVLFAVPMVSVVLFSILVGISISAMLLMMYVIAIIAASILSAVVIGQNIYTKLFKQKDNIYISMCIGILVVKLVGFIPYIGWILDLLIFFYGLGIIWKLFLDRNK